AGEKLWGVGDVTGRGAFTHVATYQADIAVADILGKPGPGADYRALPRVTFTDPEIGSVGLTEAAARQQAIRVRTGTAQTPATAPRPTSAATRAGAPLPGGGPGPPSPPRMSVRPATPGPPPASRASGCAPAPPRSRPQRAAGSTRPVTRASSSSSWTATARSSS